MSYLKSKLMKLNESKKFRNWYRDISDFKKGYQSRTNIVQDEKRDLVTVSHSVSPRWMKFFSQLFVERGFSEVRQTEIHTAEPIVRDPRVFEFHMLIEKLKAHKSVGTDQSTVELITAGSRTVRCVIQQLTNSIWKKGEVREEWK